MDDHKIIYTPPQPVQMGPIPQNLINQDLENDLNNQKSQIKFLERLLKVNVLISLLFCLIFIVLTFLLFKGNLTSLKDQAFTKANPPQSKISIQTIEANTEEPNQILINQYGVDIDKAFAVKHPPVFLTKKASLKKEVFGFLPYWNLKRANEINIDLVTSVSYFGLEVDSKGEVITKDVNGKSIEPWISFKSPEFKTFIQRAKKNKTRVYLTLKCFSRNNIEKLALSPDAQTNFITKALYLMNADNLDGINLDWEYIGTPSQPVRDGFSSMVIRLNKEMKASYPNAKLTIDTFVDAAQNTRIHDVSVLAQNSDALVIMGYDFSTPNSAQAGAVAPMGGYALNLTSLLGSYLDKAPADKLILAVPYYGYGWPVAQATKNAAVTGTSADVAVIPYAEILDNNKNTQFNWDDSSLTPWYSYRDSQDKLLRVVHFENTRSLGVKYDYIKEKNLQGLGIWALGFDGYRTDLLQLISDKFSN